MIFHYSMANIECARAAKSEHNVILYDENDNVIWTVSNIYGDEWSFISLEGGEWEEILPEPTEVEILQNYVQVLRADLDYCLMLLEEE